MREQPATRQQPRAQYRSRPTRQRSSSKTSSASSNEIPSCFRWLRRFFASSHSYRTLYIHIVIHHGPVREGISSTYAARSYPGGEHAAQGLLAFCCPTIALSSSAGPTGGRWRHSSGNPCQCRDCFLPCRPAYRTLCFLSNIDKG